MTRAAWTYPVLVFLLFLLLMLVSLLWSLGSGKICLQNWGNHALRMGLTSYVLVMALLILDHSSYDMSIGRKILRQLPFLRAGSNQEPDNLKDEIWKSSIPLNLLLFVILAVITIWTF